MSDLIANRYRPLKSLGEGAMGQVWLVEDGATGDRLALKLVSAKLEGGEKAVLQLKQEFRLMTQLRHPHIVEEQDYGLTADGQPYFTMEVVPGCGLDERVPMPPDEVRRVMVQALSALGYLHRLDLVHGDIKPANMRLTPDGTLKLMDFGLMEYAGRTGGAIKGTLAYLAPEVIKRASVDGRTDLYALGAVAYELLTGQPPFVRPTAMGVLQAHVGEPPVPPTRLAPAIPEDLERWVLRMIAKDPLERPQSAEEAIAALDADAPAAAGGRLLTSSLVGREPEVAALADRLAHLTAGRPGGAVAVIGAAGLGKSRLIEEFRYQVLLAEVPVALGMAQEHSHAPYGPWISVLKALLPLWRAHTPEALAQHGPAIAPLLPDSGLSAPQALATREMDKARTIAAIAHLVAELARARRLVLVLGDWQWADALSRELATQVIRALADTPALVIVTSRRDLVEGAELLRLGGLNAESVGRMVAEMLGTADAEERLVDLVHDRSAGNPFMIERLLVHLVQAGHLAPTSAGWRLGDAFDAETLPRHVGVLIGEKLRDLSLSALIVAGISALVGRVADLALIARATGLDEPTLFAALGELRRAQILMQQQEGSYRFQQEQFRDVLIAHMTSDERLKGHQAIARALLDRVGDQPLDQLPLKQVTAIAHHALEGRLGAVAVKAALAASLRHHDLHAPDEAERFLRGGLAALEAHGGSDADRLAYLSLLADVVRWQGEMEAALGLYRDAALVAERLGDRAALGRLMSSLAKAYRGAEDFDEALACGERALAIALDIRDAASAARALIATASVRALKGQSAGAIADAERALALAKDAGHAGYQAQALSALGYHLVAHDPARRQAGIGALETAVRLYEQLGSPVGLANAYDALGNARYCLGDWPGAEAAFTRALALAESAGVAAGADFARLNLAFVAVEAGRFTEAADLAARVHAGAVTRERQFDVIVSRTLGAVALAGAGRLAEAEAAMAEGLAGLAEAAAEDHELFALVRWHEAQLALTLGDGDRARKAADAMVALLAASPDAETEARVAIAAAEVALAAGQPAQARLAAERALKDAGHLHAEGLRVRALAALTAATLAEEDWTLSAQWGAEGLALAEHLGSCAQAARIHGLLGERALAIGEPETARTHFTAMATFTEAPATVAEARFGLAACAPYGPEAAGLAAQAAEGLAALQAGLDEATWGRFTARPALERVREGNFVGFSLPRVQSAPKPPAPSLWQGLN